MARQVTLEALIPDSEYPEYVTDCLDETALVVTTPVNKYPGHVMVTIVGKGQVLVAISDLIELVNVLTA